MCVLCYAVVCCVVPCCASVVGVPAGLGTESGACHIVSGEDNRGDGIVLCGKDPQALLKERGWNSSVYKVRGGQHVWPTLIS